MLKIFIKENLRYLQIRQRLKVCGGRIQSRFLRYRFKWKQDCQKRNLMNKKRIDCYPNWINGWRRSTLPLIKHPDRKQRKQVHRIDRTANNRVERSIRKDKRFNESGRIEAKEIKNEFRVLRRIFQMNHDARDVWFICIP